MGHFCTNLCLLKVHSPVFNYSDILCGCGGGGNSQSLQGLLVVLADAPRVLVKATSGCVAVALGNRFPTQPIVIRHLTLIVNGRSRSVQLDLVVDSPAVAPTSAMCGHDRVCSTTLSH